MLRLLHTLNEFSLAARDGRIGKVKDFLFDEQHWTIRYLVADTGNWIPERKVLISPVSLGSPDWNAKELPVNMTKDEVESQPDLSRDAPVSRQHEQKWAQAYGYPYYWTGPFAWGYGVAPSALFDVDKVNESVMEQARKTEGDPHLRSLEEIRRYRIKAADGNIGHVEDLVMDDDTWTIRYVVVDTRKWLPGKKVLLALGWFHDFSWSRETLGCDLPKEKIKSSPEFDPGEPVNSAYEERLHDYYGKPLHPETASRK